MGFHDVEVNSTRSEGSAVIIFGSNVTRENPFELTAQTGYAFSPAMATDRSGRSVSAIGDFNGDGFDDLIIGVPFASRCYVLFGTGNGFVNMTQGFTIFGAHDSDLTDWSVSGGGDVNNDTLADFIFSVPRASTVYVVFGTSSAPRDLYLADLPLHYGFAIKGEAAGDFVGLSVSAAGDVNGDGYGDVVLSSLQGDGYFAGAVHVVYGNATEHLTDVGLKTLQQHRGFSVRGTAWSYLGYSVAGVGDVNGDGLDDLLMGSLPQKGLEDSAPVSYVIYGARTQSLLLSVTSLTKEMGLVIAGEDVS